MNLKVGKTTSTLFEERLSELSNTFVKVIKKLCTAKNLSSYLEACVVYSLIHSDKNPELGIIVVPVGDDNITSA